MHRFYCLSPKDPEVGAWTWWQKCTLKKTTQKRSEKSRIVGWFWFSFGFSFGIFSTLKIICRDSLDPSGWAETWRSWAIDFGLPAETVPAWAFFPSKVSRSPWLTASLGESAHSFEDLGDFFEAKFSLAQMLSWGHESKKFRLRRVPSQGRSSWAGQAPGVICWGEGARKTSKIGRSALV